MFLTVYDLDSFVVTNCTIAFVNVIAVDVFVFVIVVVVVDVINVILCARR